jgi:hypothetical protein
MKQVTKDQFYKAIGNLDVHPRVNDPKQTTFETPGRLVIGITKPGYKGGAAKEYFVRDDLIKE